LTTTGLHCRQYYRCSHRTSYVCPAEKIVQRLDEDPTTIEVRYRGLHTCPLKRNLITKSGVETEFEERKS